MNATLLPARLTELGMHLDVDGTPCNGSLTVAPALDPAAGPAAAMGVFLLTKDPTWTPEQMAAIARDLAAALHAAATDIETQYGTAGVWAEPQP